MLDTQATIDWHTTSDTILLEAAARVLNDRQFDWIFEQPTDSHCIGSAEWCVVEQEKQWNNKIDNLQWLYTPNHEAKPCIKQEPVSPGVAKLEPRRSNTDDGQKSTSTLSSKKSRNNSIVFEPNCYTAFNSKPGGIVKKRTRFNTVYQQCMNVSERLFSQ